MPASPPPPLGPDKALAVGAYGETVAAYRYLVFAERVSGKPHRDAFAAMADEEQNHKQRLQALLARLYPDADFVLSERDKELVVVGPRVLDVRDDRRFAEALDYTLQTEQRTSAFYRSLSQTIRVDPLCALFQELAEEGAEHYHRLRDLVRDVTAHGESQA
jgi:rubrerythrin